MNSSTVSSPAPGRFNHSVARFADLKRSVSHRLSRHLRHALPEVLMRRAIDEASQVAEQTGFPLLVFPLLAEETVERVRLAVQPNSMESSAPLAA